MHRSARPLREDLDDLEDKSWKRKSYALAQHNALPIPMPHPVYPPPIACPPPAVVIRPSRLRSRPPGAGYRHPASYHPAIRQNYYQRPPPPNRLPTLSETNPGTPNQPLPLRKAPPPPIREDPNTETYPREYGGVPPSQPELSTFRAPPPARHVIQPASQQRPDIHALPSRPPDIDSSARPSNIPVPVARSSHIPAPSSRPSNIPQPQSRIEAVTTPPSRPIMIPERDAPIYDTVQPTFSTFAPPLPPSPPADFILPPPPPNTLLLPQHILQSSPSPPLKRKISPSLPSPTYLFPQHRLQTSPSPPPPVRKMPPSTPVKPPTLPEPTLPPPPPPITTFPPPQQTQSSHSAPPPVQKMPPAVPIKPPSIPEPMRTPPPPHTTPLPPQPTLHFPTSSPPVVHKTPPTLPIKPPSTSPQIQPKEPRTDKPLPSPPSPAQKLPHNKKVPVPPRPKEAPPNIPTSPAKMPEVTPEIQVREKLLPGAESVTTPPKAPQTHTQCLDKPVIPSKPASHVLQADDDGLASTPASHASEPGEEQDTSRIPAVSPDKSPGEDSKKLQPIGNTSNLNSSPVKPKPISMQPNSLPEDSIPTRQVSRVPESPKTESSSTTSPTELNSPHEDSSSASQVSKVSDQHETKSSESISNTSPTEDSSSAPQVSKVPETLTTESSPMTSPLSDKTNPQSVTRAPQHLPLTPSSQSRSSSLASIGCLRTPPSIRAAPSWQPIFLPAPLTRKSTSASNSESSLSPRSSNATPRPTIPPDECQNILPTPPSSPSQTRVDNVTPASSISSLPHGHGQSLAGEEEDMQHQPAPAEDGPDTPRSSPPDMTLHNAEKADIPVVNNISQMESITATPSKPVPATETYQTYKTRFWILTVFSFICFLQTIVWGTFGPIAESAQAAFPSWDDSTIAAFPNWGPIIVVVFIIPMVWLSQRLGLQIAMIVCELFLTLGTMIRCFTSNEAVFTVMCHVSSVLFAFAACFTLSLPAMVAATWFPPSERITATAVGTLMCQLGAAAMYLGALVVRYPSSKVVSSEEREAIRGDIMVLMYMHFGAALLLLLAVAIYFPAKPPTPPSASSEEERIDYFKAFRVIFKKLQMAIVLMVFAFSFGVPVVWIAVLNLSLKDIGINQDKAMGVAVTAVVCSSVTAFIAARITDKVYGHLKVTVIALLAISSVFFLWFLLLTTKVIYPTLGQVYVAVAGGLGFEYATVPLLVELAVEIGFPIPESVTGATLTFVFNIVSLVFLGLFQIPNEAGHLWVSCVLLACVSLSIIPLIFVKETHKRSDTDRKFM